MLSMAVVQLGVAALGGGAMKKPHRLRATGPRGLCLIEEYPTECPSRSGW
jgi:hypothetical protein